MDQNSAIQLLNSFLDFLKSKQYNIEKAYLFGSYARGNQVEDSDIDLAIVMRNMSNSFFTQIELMNLSRRFDSRIEPHPIDAKKFNDDNPLAHEVIKNGIPLLSG